MKTDVASLSGVFESQWDRILDEWKQFLRLPSVSTEPAHAADCSRCAAWLAGHLRGMGFAAECLETPSKPIVYAERSGAPGRPTVLFYGHYDVQPVDPLEAWITPPFEPTLRNGRLYARGAQDNKGQVFYVLKALEHLIRNGWSGATVKILIEGEEENGSAALAAALPGLKDRLRADILMVCDTDSVAPGTPTITMGLRGVVFADVALRAADHDLHSGLHGGVAPNPAHGMARLVASLHRNDGSVAVEGFYDGVIPPSDRERELAAEFPIDACVYTRETGAPPVAGEQQYTPRERIGFRPALDINGLHSGYGGPGSKTIIPSTATAKISARIVPGQDPERCLQAIVRHLQRHTPEGMSLTVSDTHSTGPGFRLNVASPLVARARDTLERIGGRKAAFLWEGASVPIVAALAAATGAEPLLVGFGGEEDRIHAPNESFSSAQFRLGFLYAAAFLAEA